MRASGATRVLAEAHARGIDNPLLITNRKAKRLKSLLMRQRAFRGEQVPFIAPLVFLSHPELDCRLAPDARTGVHGLDRDESAGEPTQRGGLTGIVEALTSLTSEERERWARGASTSRWPSASPGG